MEPTVELAPDGHLNVERGAQYWEVKGFSGDEMRDNLTFRSALFYTRYRVVEPQRTDFPGDSPPAFTDLLSRAVVHPRHPGVTAGTPTGVLPGEIVPALREVRRG